MASDALDSVRGFANAIPVAFWAAQGQADRYSIVVWNQAAERLYGIKTTDAMGSSFVDLFVQPWARESAARECDLVISGAYTHPQNTVAFDQRPDGSLLFLLTNVFQLAVDGKRYQAEISVDLASSGFGSFVDNAFMRRFISANAIPGVRTLGALVEHRLDQERQTSEHWAACLAHDLRASAGSALDSLNSLSERRTNLVEDPDVVQMDYVLRAMVRRTDTFVGVFAGQRAGDIEIFDAMEVLESELANLDYYGSRVFETSVEFQHRPSSAVLLRGRAESLRQCLYGLMENACNYNRPKRGDPKVIEVAAEVDRSGAHGRGDGASYFIVAVSNPGKYDPGDRTLNHPTDRVSLGLDLVRRLISEAGGELHLANDAQRGFVTAKLSWPIVDSE